MTSTSKKAPLTTKPKSVLANIATKNLIDSKRLFYFFHVAKLGSFSTAEAALDVVQSALSRQVQLLEAEIGSPLFDRHGRGVVLTPAGELLFKQAATIFEGMASTLSAIDMLKRGGGGKLSIATPPIFSLVHMPRVIAKFTQVFPDVQLSAFEASTGQVFDYLVEGQVDLAVVLHQSSSQRLSLIKLTVESLVLIVGKAHPLASLNSISRKDVPRSLLLTSSTHGSRTVVEQYFAEEGIELAPHVQIDGVSMTKALIAQGNHCTIFPEVACAAELASGEFVAIPLNPPLKRTLYLAHLRDRVETPHMKVMIQAIAESVHSRR